MSTLKRCPPSSSPNVTFTWGEEDDALFPLNPFMNRRVVPLGLYGPLTPEEVCPICTGPVSSKIRVLYCCGNIMCFQCHLSHMRHTNESGIPQLCPMCRSMPVAYSDEWPKLLSLAAAGKPWAHELAAIHYAEGKPLYRCDADAEKALYHSLEAHKLGNYYATWLVAYLYIFGLPGKPGKHPEIYKPDVGIEFLRVAAHEGRIKEALMVMGDCYQEGRFSFTFNTEEARRYYEEAAIHGSVEAIDRLVPMYRRQVEQTGQNADRLAQMETYLQEFAAVSTRYYHSVRAEVRRKCSL
jgi:hypothetical protein